MDTSQQSVVVYSDDEMTRMALAGHLRAAGMRALAAGDLDTATCCAKGCRADALCIAIDGSADDARAAAATIRKDARLDGDLLAVIIVERESAARLNDLVDVPSDVIIGSGEAGSIAGVVARGLTASRERSPRRSMSQEAFDNLVVRYNNDYMALLTSMASGVEPTAAQLGALKDAHDAIVLIHDTSAVDFRVRILPFSVLASRAFFRTLGLSDDGIQRIEHYLTIFREQQSAADERTAR